MTAILLPDIDLDRLRKAIPSLSEIDLPSMEQAGKKADETLDRVLGRSRLPAWPWLAVGAMLIAVIGSIVAMFGLRRWPSTAGNESPAPTDSTGITPVESSLMSTSAEDMLG
jgi:hypothetical protein